MDRINEDFRWRKKTRKDPGGGGVRISWLLVFVWIALGACGQEKTYTNPIADGVYMGDPFMIHHEGVYYLYGTTNSGEGFRCWSSRDLQEWNPEGFVFRESEETWGGSNFWAPEVHHLDGKFYLAFSCKGREAEHDRMLLCLAESDSPTGPFKEVYAPWFDMGYSCIDAHLFFDDDGKKYLYFDRVGYEGEWPDGHLYGLVYCRELNEKMAPVGDTVFVSGPEQEWEHPLSDNSRCNEGSYIMKHDGRYYMTYSANHYRDPFYGIGVSTADHPLGPWTKSEDNPLIGLDKEREIFGPGHNCFMRSPDGSELFIVYHTHVSEENKQREVNIDRVKFDETGRLLVKGPTRTPQPVPSGTK